MKTFVLSPLLGLMLLLGAVAPAGAQGRGLVSPPFTINREARFAAIFPAPPVASDVTYSIGGMSYPARQFSVTQNGNVHTVTVIRLAAGPAVDIALVDRAAAELRRKGTVRYEAAEDYEAGLPGRQLSITLPDGRLLRASVHMWDRHLFILEAAGVSGTASILRFEQSLTLLGADGDEVNTSRPPPR
jgi:hypothetical protein